MHYQERSIPLALNTCVRRQLMNASDLQQKCRLQDQRTHEKVLTPKQPATYSSYGFGSCLLAVMQQESKDIRRAAHSTSMNRRTIRAAIAGCIAALAAAVAYAIIRLFVMGQRVDASILFVNVIAFAGIAFFLIYLTKKDRDLAEEELFRD